MLAAYFDETGTDRGSPVICISGYVSTCQEWLKLEKRWTKALSEEGLDWFHATDFYAAKKPPWDGFDKDEQARITEKLTRIVNPIAERQFCVAFFRKDYDKVIGSRSRYWHDRHWLICATMAIKSVLNWAEQERTSTPAPIVFVFDRGASKSGDCQRNYTELLKSPSMRPRLHRFLGEFVLADSRIEVPLQAADMLTWHLGRYAKDRLKNARAVPSPEYKLLTSGRPRTVLYAGERLLASFMSRVKS